VGIAPGESRHCLNCSAPLAGQYCAECGQRDSRPNPTLREYADEWFTEILHWDGKLPHTLKALMLKPGQLTEDFLAGRRIRWLSPLRTYLICSIAYFLAGPILERVTGYQAKTAARIEITGDSADVNDVKLLTDSVAFVNDPEVRDLWFVKLFGAGNMFTLANNPSRLADIVAETIPRAMFVLLPLFAFLTWLLWRSSGLAYPAHLAFAFHVHAAYFVGLLVPTLLAPLPIIGPVSLMNAFIGLIAVSQLALLAYTMWYLIVASRRALGGTTQQVVWRTTALGLIYAPVVLVCILVAIAVAIGTL
jgi:hypothetical protein